MGQDDVQLQQKKLFEEYKQHDDEMQKMVSEEQRRQREVFEERLK